MEWYIIGIFVYTGVGVLISVTIWNYTYASKKPDRYEKKK